MFKIMKLPNDCENSNEVVIDSASFTRQLKTKWDEIHSEPDVFRYKITNLRERNIDNKYTVLLNTERGSNRRVPEDIGNIRQPFDSNKFNFNKASLKEIIFNFQNSSGGADIHSFLVNISPISQYHMLLCPSINRNLPQVITEDSMKLALEIKYLARDRDLRIGFNSLCAFASVNHLHYHLLFDKNTLHVQTAKTVHLQGPVHIIQDIVVPAFCFEVTEGSIYQATRNIYRLIDYLLFKSIAHNILITSGDTVVPGSQNCEVVRVLVTARISSAGIKQLTSFNVAVLELSGWFPVFNPEHFDELNASDLETELKKWKLPNFEELCDEIKALY